MKTIAIINVPEGDGKWYLDGVIRYTEDESLMKRYDAEMIPLKPLPNEIKHEAHSLIEYISSSHQYTCGWNDCLKELEK